MAIIPSIAAPSHWSSSCSSAGDAIYQPTESLAQHPTRKCLGLGVGIHFCPPDDRDHQKQQQQQRSDINSEGECWLSVWEREPKDRVGWGGGGWRYHSPLYAKVFYGHTRRDSSLYLNHHALCAPITTALSPDWDSMQESDAMDGRMDWQASSHFWNTCSSIEWHDSAVVDGGGNEFIAEPVAKLRVQYGQQRANCLTLNPCLNWIILCQSGWSKRRRERDMVIVHLS